MLNIYDERKCEQLLFILDSEECNAEISNFEDVAVIINLYYQETVNRYIGYINQIPEDICVYIFSSNEIVLDIIAEQIKRKNVLCILKENRGRDISAFLIAAADVIFNYQIICFIHDKKPNAKHLEEDVNDWIMNLWDNTIGTEKYVKNVLKLFSDKQDLGLVAPPEPYGEYISTWYEDTWGNDYELTRELAKELDVNVDISLDKEVFVLGTVFWAKTAVLKKLFIRQWTYEDFPEEPLAIDGTISHAIERILGYVVQDAGYKTGTVMTTKYASKFMLRVQDDMRVLFQQLKKREHICNIHQIKNIDSWEQQMICFCDKYKKIYIYGAGVYGRTIKQFMQERDYKLDGFVVSPENKTVLEVEKLPVYALNEIDKSEEIGIIIGVSYAYRDEIEMMLKKYGFKDYMNGLFGEVC